MRRRGALVLAVALALAGCGDDGPDRPAADGPTSAETSSETSSEATAGSTEETATTERDYTATTGPWCTAGTVPPDAVPPPGCDRIYSPFVVPGDVCTEGQASECIDPDGDGTFTWIEQGGECLVERKDPDRCRDDDGDGALDEPLGG